MTNHFKRFFEAIDYKVTGGEAFAWACYGPHARYIDSTEIDVASASCIFDAETQIVYEVTITQEFGDYKGYRWRNPDYTAAYKAEAMRRNCEDDADYADTDCYDDILTKVTAMLTGAAYDPRVIMTIDGVEDDLFLSIAKIAHERDITINKMIERALTAAIRAGGIDDRD